MKTLTYDHGKIEQSKPDWSRPRADGNGGTPSLWTAYSRDGQLLGRFNRKRDAQDAIDRAHGRETRSKVYSQLVAQSHARGEDRDCTVVAVAAVTRRSYDEAHAALARHGRRDRHGASTYAIISAVRDLGCVAEHEYHPKVKTVRTAEKHLGIGRYLVLVRGHVLAVCGGTVHDWSRGSCRKVKKVWRVTG